MQDSPSIFDAGFQYGQGVFETMRTYNGKIFCLNEHLDRLINGAIIIGLAIPHKVKLKKAIELAIKNKRNNYVKLICWQSQKGAKFSVITKKLPKKKPYFSAMFSSIKQNDNSMLSNVKSLSYLNFLIARKIAQKKHFDEALLLNSKNFLSEGSRSNIFFVKKNQLFTPSINCGCLEGITRNAVIKIAKSNGFIVKEGNFRKKTLLCCDEAFLTNSLLGIMPLLKIDKHIIGNGLVGAKTNFLQDQLKIALKNYKNCYNN